MAGDLLRDAAAYTRLHAGVRLRADDAVVARPARDRLDVHTRRAQALIQRIVADAARQGLVPVGLRRTHVPHARGADTATWSFGRRGRVEVPTRTAQYPLKTALGKMVYGRPAEERNLCVAFALVTPHDAVSHVSTTGHKGWKSDHAAALRERLHTWGATQYAAFGWRYSRDGTDDWPTDIPVGYVLFLHFRAGRPGPELEALAAAPAPVPAPAAEAKAMVKAVVKAPASAKVVAVVVAVASDGSVKPARAAAKPTAK
jgi:hypothetical protein